MLQKPSGECFLEDGLAKVSGALEVGGHRFLPFLKDELISAPDWKFRLQQVVWHEQLLLLLCGAAE